MPPLIAWTVLFDVVLERGQLFFVIRNTSPTDPVFNVKTTFAHKIDFLPFAGRAGALFFTDLPLFQNIPFLAPGKEIRVYVDNFVSYMLRSQPMDLNITVEFDTVGGSHTQLAIHHDLKIFRGIGTIEPLEDASIQTEETPVCRP